jgi:pyrroline-5-carboxylate reductase
MWHRVMHAAESCSIRRALAVLEDASAADVAGACSDQNWSVVTPVVRAAGARGEKAAHRAEPELLAYLSACVKHGFSVDATCPQVLAWEISSPPIVTAASYGLLRTISAVGQAFRPDQTVISVAAGMTTAAIQDAIPGEVPVVRVMTNTPVQVDEAMSVVSAGTHAGDRDLDVAQEILAHVGKVIRLDEEHLDAVTALSGSGPAYFFLLAEAMIDAGILLGLPREVATQLIIQTMVGSATMLRDSGRHPVELREMVTSPGGTTITAIRTLESAGVRAAFLDAIEAAAKRGHELAGGG